VLTFIPATRKVLVAVYLGAVNNFNWVLRGKAGVNPICLLLLDHLEEQENGLRLRTTTTESRVKKHTNKKCTSVRLT
jgi:hypothetical protein